MATTALATDDSLDFFFRRYELLFGGQSEQQLALQYLERLVRRASSPGDASNRRRGAPLSTVKERRAALEASTWQPAAVRTALQTWLGDAVGAPDGMLVLAERVFPRRESKGDGLAPQFDPQTGVVVTGQLGAFLIYLSSRGRAVADARLIMPTAGASRGQLALEMLDSLHERLRCGLIVSGANLGDDELFREAIRARGMTFALEVSPSTPVFVSRSQKAHGRRPASPPKDLTRASIERAITPEAVAAGADVPNAVPVWESMGGMVGSSAWAIAAAPGADASHRCLIINASSRPTSTQVRGIVQALDTPLRELSSELGSSVFDHYDSVTKLGWERHMTLAMLASARELGRDASPTSTPATDGVSLTRTLGSPTAPPAPLPGLRLPASAQSGLGGRARMIAGGVAAILLALGAAVTIAATSIPSLGQRDLIRPSLFYHPPEDGTPIGAVVSNARQVIFTRGDERYLGQLRDRGFRGPALQYLVANETSGPERAASASAQCGEYLTTGNDVSGIARDFCSALHADERNFLHNGQGERLYSSWNVQDGNATRTRYYYMMNPGAPGWREYFARRARENSQELPYTGIFLDNIDLTLRRGTANERNSDGKVMDYPNDRAYRDAVLGYLEVVRGEVKDRALWANLTEGTNDPDEYQPYLPYLDGVMNEYFITQANGRAVGPNGWAAQLAQADSVIDRGKSFLAVSQGSRNDLNRMRFALASYLMIAGPETYFRYADGDKYEEAWLYDDYENRLGSPLGRRYQRGDIWYRDFTCGTVSVDIERRAGEIAHRAAQPQCLTERLLLKIPLVSKVFD